MRVDGGVAIQEELHDFRLMNGRAEQRNPVLRTQKRRREEFVRHEPPATRAMQEEGGRERDEGGGSNYCINGIDVRVRLQKEFRDFEILGVRSPKQRSQALLDTGEQAGTEEKMTMHTADAAQPREDAERRRGTSSRVPSH